MKDTVNRTPEGIKIHTAEDFAGMHRAGRLAAETLDMIGPEVKPGVTTEHINALIEQFIYDHDATSATIGYRGYKHASCISLNHVVCHGIPSPKSLKDGDILNIDVTVILDGWYGDTSRMFVAGTPSRKAERLINRFGDIGHAIQTHAESNRCSVVRDFCGHGLGRVFHDSPNVLHYGKAGTGALLRPGMFFTIEPMVNLGRAGTKILADGWTAVTRDRTLSAQFEHSIGVTEDGCEVFTLSPAGLFHPFTEKADAA